MIPLHDDNPTEITPFLTISFIAACVLVFLFQNTLSQEQELLFVYQYGAIPGVLFGHKALPPEVASLPAVASLVTSMFLHGGWMHLIGNMLYLWIFGNNIEEAFGRARYLAMYLIAGLAATLGYVALNPGSIVPLVGASGAIAGVLGAYLVLFPRHRINSFMPPFFVFPMPAMWFIGIWFVGQFFIGSESNIAWQAHVAGFLAGAIITRAMRSALVRRLASIHGPAARF